MIRDAVFALGLVILSAPLVAQQTPEVHTGTQLDWGNVSVYLYPTSAFGVELGIEAQARRGADHLHGVSGGFRPDSVLGWVDGAAVIVTPSGPPQARTDVLLSPPLVSSAGDSIRLMRRADGTKWEKRVVVAINAAGHHPERFDLLVLPGEATALLNGLRRESMLSGYDADSISATVRRDTLVDPNFTYQERDVDTPPTLIRPGRLRYPDAERDRGEAGRVVLDFVIDVTGEVIPGSVHTLSATGLGFVEPSRAAVLGSRFTPGRIRGQPVRVMVRQSVNYRP